MLLVIRVVVYEGALATLYALLPLWFALGPGRQLGIILAEPLQLPGLVLALFGAALWLWATVVLVARGWGAPLLVDPPERLVVGGPYRWIRHPMHVGLVVFLFGWALLFRSPLLVGWALVVAVLVWVYAERLEEPALERRFGEAYRAYRAGVPAWWPRRFRLSGRDSGRGPVDIRFFFG